MSATVTFNGWGEFQSKLKALPQVLFDEIDGECMDAAGEWEELAKLDAPKDQGFLSQNIKPYQVGLMHYEVVSGSEVSAVMEWGTGSRMKVPSDLQSYASQFKGQPSGGDYYDFLNAILDWTKRKGIGGNYKGSIEKLSSKKKDQLVETAEAIAFSIIRHGVRPHPFFFVQQPIVEKNLFDRINKNVLSKEH